MSTVRFLDDDRYGLWKQGDLADDLGPESIHPQAPPIRLLRLHRTGETLALTSPVARGICEPVDASADVSSTGLA